MKRKPSSAFKNYIFNNSPTKQCASRSYLILLRHGINTFEKFRNLDMVRGDFAKMWRGVGKSVGNNLDTLKKNVNKRYELNFGGKK